MPETLPGSDAWRNLSHSTHFLADIVATRSLLNTVQRQITKLHYNRSIMSSSGSNWKLLSSFGACTVVVRPSHNGCFVCNNREETLKGKKHLRNTSHKCINHPVSTVMCSSVSICIKLPKQKPRKRKRK